MSSKELPSYHRLRLVIDGEEVGQDPRWQVRIVQDEYNKEIIIDVRTPDAAYHRLEAAWHGR